MPARLVMIDGGVEQRMGEHIVLLVMVLVQELGRHIVGPLARPARTRLRLIRTLRVLLVLELPLLVLLLLVLRLVVVVVVVVLLLVLLVLLLLATAGDL